MTQPLTAMSEFTKSIFSAGILFLTLTSLSAQQGVKLGIQGGLPINDFNDEIGIVLAVDAGYMHALGEVVDIGFTAGFVYGFHETYQRNTPVADLPDLKFVPLAGMLRIWPARNFSFGADAGQAFSLNDGMDGGLYLRPQLGYMMGPVTELNLSYTHISLEERPWATVTLGILYTFGN